MKAYNKHGITRLAAGYALPMVILALSVLPAHRANAGGGPENVLLVVNTRSESSQAIANHYILWRQIPPINVVSIDWEGSVESCTADRFREDILKPILEAMKRRGIERQIDYVIYSSDFPWKISFNKDFLDPKPPKHATPTVSLTGATYLLKYAYTKDPQLLSLTSNHYVPKSKTAIDAAKDAVVSTPSQGFRSAYAWTPGGKRDKADGTHYLLSTMLAVTSGRGTTVDEALKYLSRSVHADGKRPRGTIYYMKLGGVRSTTRHNRFPEVVRELKSLGIRAEILDGTLPTGKQDVAGMMVGAASFDLGQAKLQILPGAICDHLTSYGGMMNANANQSPLTEFLRHGAAGASGAVVEPYAIQNKFPLPTIHLHYARGCSLAEAFYQSVAGPFQLLIVGDPLCQPWAGKPKVAVDGIESGQTVQGEIKMTPTAWFPHDRKPKYFNLYVDGKLTMRRKPGKPISLDTQKLPDGYHELRIVAIEETAIEGQGREIIPIKVDNHGRAMTFTVSPSGVVSAERTLTLTAQAEGAKAIVFTHNHRVLGRIGASQGEIKVKASELGPGPVQLRAAAISTAAVHAKPVNIRVN